MEQIQYTTGIAGPNSPTDVEESEVQSQPEESQASETDQPTEEVSKDDSTEDAQFSLEEFSNEFEKTGKLSDDSFSKLEKAGIPRSYVEQYIAGLQAAQEAASKSMYDTVGGEKAYNSMIEWASGNYSEAEIDAYNKAIQQDTATQKFALESLMSRYNAAMGVSNEPKMVRAQKTAVAAGFRSTAEMVKAMSDPRYKTDPAYRADVETKVRNASF